LGNVARVRFRGIRDDDRLDTSTSDPILSTLERGLVGGVRSVAGFLSDVAYEAKCDRHSSISSAWPIGGIALCGQDCFVDIAKSEV
jgi:hypothetical protein